MKTQEPISHTCEWTFELIERYQIEIERIAHNFKLDTYPLQLEIISSEQMLDAYASSGMPITYHHWTYGKSFLESEKLYRHGHMGLAYEIVINSNPCIAYLLEENTMAMQALVIAHAGYGHNSFFKNNYLFKNWTHADSIIDYMLFAKEYIRECEEKYGISVVEHFIDSCQSLSSFGVDRYKHPPPLSLQKETIRQASREAIRQSQVNEIWRTLPLRKEDSHASTHRRFPQEPQENILYFIEKHSPILEPWQREIVRIIRKIAQYFYPQLQTKVMNEGWATFWHYTIMNALYDEGLVSDEFMIEILHSHTSVIEQLPFDSPYYSGINPYTLGFNIFKDIQRIATNPTEEDRIWFPNIAGTDWIETLNFAMQNFKDESFIAQYLSPHLIRELKLFSVFDDDKEMNLTISAIHDQDGYQHIRDTLSKQYNISMIEPNIQVFDVDINATRTLTLRHIQFQRQPLNEDVNKVLKHLYALWKFPVKLESVDESGTITMEWRYPDNVAPESQ